MCCYVGQTLGTEVLGRHLALAAGSLAKPMRSMSLHARRSATACCNRLLQVHGGQPSAMEPIA